MPIPRSAVTGHTVTRRSLLGLAALAVVGSGTACFTPNAAPPISSGPSDGAQVPIQVWTGWTENAAKQIESILAEYNTKQSKVVAKHVVVPGDISQKLLAAIAAKNPPATAIVFGAGISYQLAARQALVAVNDIATPEELTAMKDWMIPGLWELGQFQGKTYFVPMWAQSWGVFVNVKLARAAGVDPDQPPATLEELADVWEKMTTLDARGQISVLGGNLNDVMVSAARHLGKLVSDDGTTITTDDPGVVAGVTFCDEFRERIGRKKVQDFNASLQGRSDRSGAQDPFLAGLVGSVVTGAWEFSTLLGYAPQGFEYVVWPLPKPAGVERLGTYTYGDGFIFPRGAQDPAAGWQVARMLAGISGDTDLYSSLFTTWQCVNGPTSQQAADSLTFQRDVAAKCPGYADVFIDDLFEADYFLYPPKIPTSSSYASALTSTFEKIMLGGVGIAEGLGQVKAAAQKELDQWNEQNR